MKIPVMLTREEIEAIEWALVSQYVSADLKATEAIAAILPKLHQALERVDHPLTVV